MNGIKSQNSKSTTLTQLIHFTNGVTTNHRMGSSIVNSLPTPTSLVTDKTPL